MSQLFSSLPWLRQLPNQLTLARIAVIPLLLFIYPMDFTVTNVLGALIFAAAGLTDILDGYVARRYDSETRIGALLDPLADKMLSGACIILLANCKALPAFIGGLLLCRDIGISGLRLVSLELGHTIKVSSYGKLKTVFQDVGIFCLLMRMDLFDFPFRVTGMICIWIALMLSLYSGYLYANEFLEITKNPKIDQEPTVT